LALKDDGNVYFIALSQAAKENWQLSSWARKLCREALKALTNQRNPKIARSVARRGIF
jgi:hypothetical protein